MIFFLVLGSLFAYTVFRVAELLPEFPFLGASLGALVFAIMMLALFVPRIRPASFDRWWFQILTWVGTLLIGLWASFLLLSIPFEVVRFAAWPFLTGDDFPRYFRFGTLLMFWLSLIMVALGFLEVLRGPRVRKSAVAVAGLRGPLRIAQISDLHIGATIRRRFVSTVVARTNAEDADLIVLTGDIVDAPAAAVREHLRLLGRLKARYGIFYVTGNHEYYWGVDDIRREIAALGITVLMNENRIVDVGGRRVLIGGITDPMGQSLGGEHRPDLARAAGEASVAAGAELRILLSHRPGVYAEAAAAGFDLMFAGHTHAGQFFPFSLLIGLAHRYSRGLYRHEDKLWVYVNPGTGYWGPANRFGVAPEISLIEVTGPLGT